MPTYLDSGLAGNAEIEFNAGTHDETIRISSEDYRRLADPILLPFAQPYGEGLQRVAA
jgi:Ala-tRNA(Pro) deacylase